MKLIILFTVLLLIPKTIIGQENPIQPPPPPKRIIAHSYELTNERKYLIHQLIEIEGWDDEYIKEEQNFLADQRLSKEEQKEASKRTGYENFLQFLYKSYSHLTTNKLHKLTNDANYRRTYLKAKYECNQLKTPVKNYFAMHYFMISYE